MSISSNKIASYCRKSPSCLDVQSLNSFAGVIFEPEITKLLFDNLSNIYVLPVPGFPNSKRKMDFFMSGKSLSNTLCLYPMLLKLLGLNPTVESKLSSHSIEEKFLRYSLYKFKFIEDT